MLQNEKLLRNIGFDTAEKGPSKICQLSDKFANIWQKTRIHGSPVAEAVPTHLRPFSHRHVLVSEKIEEEDMASSGFDLLRISKMATRVRYRFIILSKIIGLVESG